MKPKINTYKRWLITPETSLVIPRGFNISFNLTEGLTKKKILATCATGNQRRGVVRHCPDARHQVYFAILDPPEPWQEQPSQVMDRELCSPCEG